ncbi:MAG: phenylacetate--CoA ligase family protein [Phycisphaerae bacterium]|nr:phenylacetate--CoA ligase family protein [Phycisphaerae bacterium]
MASIREKVYWKAPYFAKNWMASWNARRLNRERFGPDYEQALREIAERDKWAPAQFEEHQRRELQKLARHAAEHVPYYRKLFAEIGVDPAEIKGPEDLVRLPILEKSTVRADPLCLLDERLDRRKLIVLHSSGTTGTPLTLYRDVRLNSTSTAFADARCHDVAGVRRRRNKSVSIGGQLVTPTNQTKPPFWVWNQRWQQLYMSSFHLAPQNLDHYVARLREFGGEYIEGYPSSIYVIARHIVDNKLEPVRFKACFTTAETLSDCQRQAIRDAFCCRTYDQYGCVEAVIFAAECPERNMHLSPEIGIVEVVDENDNPCEPGQVGQLICTGLVNHVQPFIRYRLGDIGMLSSDTCPCKSPLPLLGLIEGRTNAALVTRDGRRFGRVALFVEEAFGVAEAQIIQFDYDKFVVRVVPASNYTEADGQKVISNLKYSVGEADVRVELVDRIERTAAGKFQAIICNLPDTSSSGLAGGGV